MALQAVKPDDMLLTAWQNAVSEQHLLGYRLQAVDESTLAAVYVRKGSIPDAQRWTVAEFDSFINGQRRDLHA